MGKKDNHRRDLVALFDYWLATNEQESLINYLVSNSQLPGRRANLELMTAFCEELEGRLPAAFAELWQLCTHMVSISADEAPTNDPQEFIPFCGTVGIGSIGARSANCVMPALELLRSSASDARWRVREAVCMGLQKMLVGAGDETWSVLETWVDEGNLLQMRAAAAAVAHPEILRTPRMVLRALHMHREILEHLQSLPDRKTESFRVLRKGLGYTFSLVVQAAPDEGFAFMFQLAEIADRDIRWIVRENLKKNRLARNYPAQVESIKALMERES